MVYKQILSIFLRNKTKPFSVAKPFYDTFSQSTNLLALKILKKEVMLRIIWLGKKIFKVTRSVHAPQPLEMMVLQGFLRVKEKMGF